MRVFTIAVKDLVQVLKDKQAAFYLVLLPLGFTAAFGYAFADVDKPEPLRVTVLARGEMDRAARALVESMRAEPGIEMEVKPHSPAVLEKVTKDVRKKKVDAALTAPAGMAEALTQGALPPLAAVADVASGRGRAALGVVERCVARLEGAAFAARQVPSAEFWTVWPEALAAFEAAPAKIEPRGVRADSRRTSASGFAQFSPGILVQFVIVGLMSAAAVVFTERSSGTWRRLLAAPLRPLEIVLGHGLAMFALVFTQASILIVVGDVLFGVPYHEAPLGIFAVLIGLSAWVTGMGLCIGIVAKREEHVILLSLLAMFFFTGLGGAWFPLEQTGPTFAAIGGALPSGLAMEGLQNVVVRGQGASSTWRPALGLLLYAVGFFATAAWLLKVRRA